MKKSTGGAGPGTYEAKDKVTRASSPSAFISKASKHNLKINSDAPGAGQYNPKMSTYSPSF
jgi:hypothetical protein